MSPKKKRPAKRGPAKPATAEQKARRALGLGAGALLAGIALVGIEQSDGGMVLCLLGLLVLIYGIHTFGRLGPEEA